MLKKLPTLKKTYFINWTPNDVCRLLQEHAIQAEHMIQNNKSDTNKLIRDLYLLACQACLNCGDKNNEQARLLRSYADSIKKKSIDYDKLFRRTAVTEMHNLQNNDAISEQSIDRLQARLFYLMTQYSVNPCQHLAGHIVEQLTHLCRHPHIELMPAQHYIYSQSINYWRSRLINNGDRSCNRSVH